MIEKRFLLKTVLCFFIALCILFIPFPFNLLDGQVQITDFIFGRLINFFTAKVFGITLADTKVHSDSLSMYILILLLLIFSIIIALLLSLTSSWKKYRPKVYAVTYAAGCYYVAMMLLKYGLDKIFKTQFYLPEPNTLYTPLGRVDKDLLYWTAMGTSRMYNMFIGWIEGLAAILILFKGSRIAGLLLALVSLIQVVAINFGFDISVKLYSLFLFFLCLYLLSPFYSRLYYSLFTQSEVPVAKQDEPAVFIKHPFISMFMKYMVTGLIFLEAFYPTVRSGNVNDDVAERPYLHGAYEVNQIINGSDTLNRADYPVKRFFIHRNGYFIFQDPEDHMKDYALVYDTINHFLLLKDYQLRQTTIKYKYIAADSTLTLQYSYNGKQCQLQAKALDWKKLPALQKSFHWLVNGKD